MAFEDEFLNIDTPENVIFGYEVVGIGSRFMAALVDTLAIVVIQVVVNLTMFLLANNVLNVDMGAGWVTAVFGLIAFALLWGYYIFFEMLWNGQSPGKRLVGLRVLKADGTPITLTESIVRNLIRLVDFLPLFYGVGVVVMFINAQSRRLGDLAAGTLVVRDQADLTLENLTTTSRRTLPFQIPLHIAEQVSSWPLERLTKADIQLAEEYLMRHSDLENAPRLALQILRRFYDRMELPEPQVAIHDRKYFLAQIIKEQQHDG
ncbi:MAG: RDD family protein [Ardenticatenaceae bacterium]|nr:RDD family protein [Ardenticatenaceae bacterium]